MLQEPHQMIQIIICQWWLLMIVNDELQGTHCNFSIWDFEPWDSVIQSGVSLSGRLFNYWNVGKFCIEKFITYILWMWNLVCHSNKRTYVKGWLSSSLVSNKSTNQMQKFLKFITWCLLVRTAQHVLGVLTPIIRSSTTAVAASGYTVGVWW